MDILLSYQSKPHYRQPSVYQYTLHSYKVTYISVMSVHSIMRQNPPPTVIGGGC